jgi:hypothetical protein
VASYKVGPALGGSFYDVAGHAQEARSRRPRDPKPSGAADQIAESHSSRVAELRYLIVPFVVAITLGLVDGRVEPIGLVVRGYANSGDSVQPIRADAMRLIPIGALVDRATADYRKRTADHKRQLAAGGNVLSDPGYRPLELDAAERTEAALAATSKRRRGRPPVDPARIERAAELWAEAYPVRRDRTIWVAEQMNISRSQASRYIARAKRDKILLPSGATRKSGAARTRSEGWRLAGERNYQEWLGGAKKGRKQ